MRRYVMKKTFLILLLHFLIFFTCSTAVKPNANGVCISKGGIFPPYVSEGKHPMSANLNLCKFFQRNTCCSASLIKRVSLALESLAIYGEADKNCLELFERLECAICDPSDGIQSGHLRICASFCDRLFEACSKAFFSTSAGEKIRAPCGVNEDIICGKASYLESNGTAFCDAVGLTVQTAFDSIREPCYGNEGMVPVSSERTLSFLWFQDFQQEFKKMTGVQRISWVVTGVYLGGKLIYRWYMHREVQAMIQIHGIRLGDRRNRNMNGHA